MSSPKLEIEQSGVVRREKFEKFLAETVNAPLTGWNGTFAMVTLGVMFVARSISDVATAIKEDTHHADRRHSR